MPPSRRSIRCFISIPTAKNPDLAYTVRRRSNLRLTRVLRTFSKIIRKLELVQKEILKTDFRITLARVTNDQELAKIDPDTGLQQDVGPSIIRSITVSARRSVSGNRLFDILHLDNVRRPVCVVDGGFDGVPPRGTLVPP